MTIPPPPIPPRRSRIARRPRLRSPGLAAAGLAAALLAAPLARPARAAPPAQQQQQQQQAQAAQAQEAAKHMFVRSAQTMGTRVTLSLWSHDEAEAARAAAAVFEEFQRVDALMTSWGEDSDVARINAAAGGPLVRVDAEVMGVLQRAQQIARRSAGAFDITVGAFRGLWKFDQDKDGSIPAADEVAARLPLVGYRGVRLAPGSKRAGLRRAGMRITLGGIAKGYAVDRAVALLRARGYRDFLIQAGGDLFVAGRRGDRPWRVGIRDPRGDAASPFAVAEIENQTFSTSGDYERSVVRDGVRYHHILDPSSGRPADKSRSVTVMAADALTADAWSTALFVMGAERGLPLVEKLPGVEAVFVDADNRVHVSSGLQDKLHVLRPPTPGI
ncbi:FAD:protein FMN transferase [Haliangium ochraceum]|uniref:FAD:protein FMN transferase n=1 Tax=Haliangium ochraceum (strain DSM 14365 / JCM 11303 / SMP-2) TaxID=502025 RepID=D0LJG3_HALO1|nr:FAD:protein FMN transferase [Haliangium ochraceum]ACY16537.1 ApbE family lipoprotein [Haliangium ochraceum DSM 14365]